MSDGLNITIDSDAIRKMVTENVLATIGPEQRESMLRDALATLVTHTDAGYGRKGPSPLQAAFNNAVRSFAEEIAETWIQEPEVQQVLEREARVALAKLLEYNWSAKDELGGAIAKAIETSLRDN